MVLPSSTLILTDSTNDFVIKQPEFHFDIGYDGVFAHYRSNKFPEWDEEKVVEQLKLVRNCLDVEKKGIKLKSFVTLSAALEKLEGMGFYLINFQTKKMYTTSGSDEPDPLSLLPADKRTSVTVC